MANKPEVSMVVVCYNNLEYTRKCIDSILLYTDILYELIVVNNGSTDDTKEYLEAISIMEDNCKTITLDKNYRLCRGLMKGSGLPLPLTL